MVALLHFKVPYFLAFQRLKILNLSRDPQENELAFLFGSLFPLFEPLCHLCFDGISVRSRFIRLLNLLVYSLECVSGYTKQT